MNPPRPDLASILGGYADPDLFRVETPVFSFHEELRFTPIYKRGGGGCIIIQTKPRMMFNFVRSAFTMPSPARSQGAEAFQGYGCIWLVLYAAFAVQLYQTRHRMDNGAYGLRMGK